MSSVAETPGYFFSSPIGIVYLYFEQVFAICSIVLEVRSLLLPNDQLIKVTKPECALIATRKKLFVFVSDVVLALSFTLCVVHRSGAIAGTLCWYSLQ